MDSVEEFLQENVDCEGDEDPNTAQKIYNVVAKIKKNRMQGRNTVEEILCLSAQWGYTVFYRNRKESNILSDIVVAHLTSIAIVRTWPYVLIMDTTCKTNKYNIPLLEAVGMTPIGKNFTVATAFMCNEQTMTYRWHGSILNDGFWTSQVLYFGVETTNRVERKHSVLKLWLSTCYGDLDTVFLNIDSLIKGQIVEIKTSLEISKLKEKYSAKSNVILTNISNKISHLGLKIWLEIKKASEMVENPENKCLHYIRKLHSLPCACELLGRCQYLLPLQEEDVYIFWRKLEIGVDIPNVHEGDMNSEMRDLTSILEEISTGPISKVQKVRRLIKVMKGRQKTNSTKRDKSYWKHVSIAYRKIGKSRGSGSGSRSTSGSGSSPSPRGRSRSPRCGGIRGRGRSTTVLPLYSNMDCTIGMLFIGFISEQDHFIQLQLRDGCPLSQMQVQWQYHQDVRVSGWAEPYHNWIVDWVMRYRETYPT
ncbi:hypothetical protein M9H77_26877 [Catharanthus roseus]|uniref:Uncharacterized protein n=1 Tax=Catharanthus roseus TaxID=4058 RepID=A0ACC0ABS9_CATRO|nr:hypothetical protein M9H77_26877 [Catharanthus roseus]